MLQNCFLGIRKAHKDAHENQKILTSPQEETLLKWMCHHAKEGHPWGREALQVKVEQLTGHKPSTEWEKAFRGQHREVLKFCGTSGLDPKCAQAFNPVTIADHFLKLKVAMDKHQYKPSNIYNFDKMGMQIGGGRKYRKRNANLELVTVIEIGLTKNGWTDNLQGAEWLTKSFIPQAHVTIKPETVRVAFRKMGVTPFNAEIYTVADFAPSRTTSTKAYLPLSFPFLSAQSHLANESDHMDVDTPEEPHPFDDHNHDSDTIHDSDDNNSNLEIDDEMELEHSPLTSAGNDTGCAIGLDAQLLEPSWGPKLPQFQCTPMDKHMSALRSYLNEFHRHQTPEMHCKMAGQEIQKLKTNINLKKDKVVGRKLNQFQTESKFLTGAECDAHFEAIAKEKRKKAQIDTEKSAAKVILEKQIADE
ncbi:hypothetical protein NEOLEDRAFT_1147649 [Neolentinus lepideus HHB14362 ss-1]|uniref:HTH CENPB-type domain-containing protein n=1 Tax=Neolentinus lepideus HHB14362 ss-1 TaxID=1314782 RepID=A0A165SZP0_9AGAM|nr:hypothetical protein NEOLEDRAFT_1147649 [Neolentinus lepideus HHB14362 ss-1]